MTTATISAAHPSRPAAIGAVTPLLYRPGAVRPLRAKLQQLSPDTRVVPHRHP